MNARNAHQKSDIFPSTGLALGIDVPVLTDGAMKQAAVYSPRFVDCTAIYV
jgi:hypothetical protein